MKIFLSFLVLLMASTALGEEHEFNFSDKSDSKTIAFTNDLNVKISGVNQYDFDYKISVDGVEAKKEDHGKGAFGDWLEIAMNGVAADPAESSSNLVEDQAKMEKARSELDLKQEEVDFLSRKLKRYQFDADLVSDRFDKLNIEQLTEGDVENTKEELETAKQNLSIAFLKLRDVTRKLELATRELEEAKTELKKAQNKRFELVNEKLKKRMSKFAFAPWDTLNKQIFKDIHMMNDKAIRPDTDPMQFCLEVNGVDLSKAAVKAGEGGVVVITVSVKPMPSKAVAKDDSISVVRKAGNFNDPAIKGHIETRTYRIQFKPKKRIRTSLGPFISGVKPTKYEKVLAPDGSFVVDKTDEGDSSSGVTIAWNVEFYRPCSALAFGLQWGLAYSPQKEAHEAVLGLMGLCIYPGNQETVYLATGVAFGKEAHLTGGWVEGSPIEPDQDLPTKSHFIGRHYLALAFNF